MKRSSFFIIVLMSITHSASAQPAPNPATQPTSRPADANWKILASQTETEFVIDLPYTQPPELTVKDGVPKGTVHRFTMKSEDSKFYSGISRARRGEVVPYTRDVAVYVPAQYVPGTAAPFMVIHDGIGYLTVTRTSTQSLYSAILDNMIHEKRLPVMIAIFVNSGGSDGQGSQRGLEYDTVSGRYTEFLEAEVLPKVSKDYNITLTKDPDGRATAGGSSGGAAAFSMGWFHPELYRRILTYSGTYVNQQSPQNPDTPRGAWEYHQTLIPNSEKKPLRIWLHVSERDNNLGQFRDWVAANNHMAAVLKAKGYTYRYVFSKNSGHTDRTVIANTLPGALEWLWEGYPK